MEHLFLVFKVTAWRSPFRIQNGWWGGAAGGLVSYDGCNFDAILRAGNCGRVSIDTLDGDETAIRMRYKTPGIYNGRRQGYLGLFIFETAKKNRGTYVITGEKEPLLTRQSRDWRASKRTPKPSTSARA